MQKQSDAMSPARSHRPPEFIAPCGQPSRSMSRHHQNGSGRKKVDLGRRKCAETAEKVAGCFLAFSTASTKKTIGWSAAHCAPQPI
jgi:hypothetical protein